METPTAGVRNDFQYMESQCTLAFHVSKAIAKASLYLHTAVRMGYGVCDRMGQYGTGCGRPYMVMMSSNDMSVMSRSTSETSDVS